jgi:hypothetical protein
MKKLTSGLRTRGVACGAGLSPFSPRIDILELGRSKGGAGGDAARDLEGPGCVNT